MKFTLDFPRYLAAKKTVDDRALNKDVWRALGENMPDKPAVLEVGAGIGTMVERLIEHRFITGGHYKAIDIQPRNIAIARERFQQQTLPFSLSLESSDLFELFKQPGQEKWDVVIAHAFLDLINVPAALPQLFAILKPHGLFYLSLNFDGATIFEPEIDPVFDALVERLYHQTMDERMTNGRLSGDSRSGRHLFHHIQKNNAEIIAAGSSDWIVFAGPEGYPADEAYFLQFIIHTINQSLQCHPDVNKEALADWVALRLAQIEEGTLIYIAHQIDILGRVAWRHL